jgi:hypothetical protein
VARIVNRVRAFQIFYNDATRASLDPDFEPLDNTANERPDWYEYWPIRRYFLANKLEDSVWYGFFSPLFFQKTRLSGKQVFAFAQQAGDADVITFSPHPCHGAAFWNVFEQGANVIPGFLDAATPFLQTIDPAIRLDALVNDSRNTVYANYFLAKPAFWDRWYGVFDRMFGLAETPGSPLHGLLNKAIEYTKDGGESKPAQMKIMIMERVVSLMLASRAFRIRNYPPFEMPLSAPFVGRTADLVALDALKIAYAETGGERYLRLFIEKRDDLLASVLRRP